MRRGAATLLLLAGVAHADANGVPAGADFQVNSYTTTGQRYGAIATTPDGGFIVVWESRGSNGSDSSFDSIQGRRFAADGAPLDDDFQINSFTTLSQVDPAIAVDADGDFVVVWQSYGSYGSDNFAWSIQGQRYSGAGVPQGGEFQINSYTTGTQQNPAVAAAPNGDFVVVWDTNAASGDLDNFSVQGQRFSADGEPQEGQFQVNTYTTSQQIFPAVAAAGDGSFVVAFQSRGSFGDDVGPYSVQVRRFSPEGIPQGPEFQVNTYTSGFQADASIAMAAAGDFVVVWKSLGSNGTDTSSYSIQGQRFAANGDPQGGEFQINSYTTSFQQNPAVASDADGDFVVVWRSVGSVGGDNSLGSIQGQRYAADGVPQGGQFQVNSYTPLEQKYPAVAMDGDGGFVVVWHGMSPGGVDPTSENVQGRRFQRSLFADGFESGDAANWSAIVP